MRKKILKALENISPTYYIQKPKSAENEEFSPYIRYYFTSEKPLDYADGEDVFRVIMLSVDYFAHYLSDEEENIEEVLKNTFQHIKLHNKRESLEDDILMTTYEFQIILLDEEM